MRRRRLGSLTVCHRSVKSLSCLAFSLFVVQWLAKSIAGVWDSCLWVQAEWIEVWNPAAGWCHGAFVGFVFFSIQNSEPCWSVSSSSPPPSSFGGVDRRPAPGRPRYWSHQNPHGQVSAVSQWNRLWRNQLTGLLTFVPLFLPRAPLVHSCFKGFWKLFPNFQDHDCWFFFLLYIFSS